MWHPENEAEAASGATALVEWLRATGRWKEAEPARLAEFLAGRPVGVDPELDAFRALAGPLSPPDPPAR